MTETSKSETARQFRVLKQTLSMHAFLRDSYRRCALVLELIILGASVVFCATRFAGEGSFKAFGVTPTNGRILFDLCATIAFFASLVLIRIDWKGKSALHRDAVIQFTKVLSLFTRNRNEDDKDWPVEATAELHEAYWEVSSRVVEIPANAFLRLKSKHLRKIVLSRLLDDHPQCPIFVMAFYLRCRGILQFLRSRTK